jgi:hypothetical protein
LSFGEKPLCADNEKDLIAIKQSIRPSCCCFFDTKRRLGFFVPSVAAVLATDGIPILVIVLGSGASALRAFGHINDGGATTTAATDGFQLLSGEFNAFFLC